MSHDAMSSEHVPPRRIEVLDGTATIGLSVEALLSGLLAVLVEERQVQAVVVALQVQAHLDAHPTQPLQLRANRLVRPSLDGGAA